VGFVRARFAVRVRLVGVVAVMRRSVTFGWREGRVEFCPGLEGGWDIADVGWSVSQGDVKCIYFFWKV